VIRLLIVDDIPSTRDNLQKLLSFEEDIEVCGTAADGNEAIDQAHKLHPDIILMDVNMPGLDGIQATERLAHALPSSPVIIMSVQGERDYLRRAMQAGAREFLIKPFSHDELVAAIRRVHELEVRKNAMSPRPAAPQPTSGGPMGPTMGEVFVVFSGKGGVGKTTIASNLAVSIAAETKARVGLVDLDLQFGDVGVMFNIDHPRSITDLTESPEVVDVENINSILADGPNGVRVLLSPLSPELADLVTAEHVKAIFGELRKMFDYIIVDASSQLSETTLEVIEIATKILVVTSLTIPSIKTAKLALKVLESLEVSADEPVLVVNRVDSYGDFNREAIESNLRTKVAVQLPHDPQVVGVSITRGAPFVQLQPEAEISRSIRELAGKLLPSAALAEAGAGGDDAGKRKRGFFGR
jgi:pilus assembly protein CpaE